FGGQEIISPTSIYLLPSIVPDGSGGQVAAWSARGTAAQGTDAFASAIHANGRPARVDHAGPASLPSETACPARLALELSSPHPRAQVSPTVMKRTLPRSAQARLEVFDVAGRFVALGFNGMLPAGRSQLTWSGHDATGRRIGAGLYFYRLSVGKDRVITRGI